MMRLIPVVYFGFTAMDKRFSSPMLPWIVSEIRKREHFEKLSVGVEDGCLQVYNGDFEIQFSHRVSNMSRFSQADLDPCTFLYLLRDDVDQLLYCYLFQAYQLSDVTDLYQQMKEQSSVIPTLQNQTAARSLSSSAATLTSLCVDISPSSSNFFEVLYIGKIKVWQKKVPDTFIDDALQKFKVHDIERARKKLGRLKSEINLRRSIDLSSVETPQSREASPPVPKLTRSYSLLSNLSIKSPDVDRKVPQGCERIAELPIAQLSNNSSSIVDDDLTPKILNAEEEQNVPKLEPLIRPNSLDNENSQSDTGQNGGGGDLGVVKRETMALRRSSSVYSESPVRKDNDEHNRTMVLQIDRTDLRLISPDRKVILLSKQHKDVFTCLQGVINTDHFGFICREAGNLNTFIGYVFRCESYSVAGETVAAITQAFTNADAAASRGSNNGNTGTGTRAGSIASCEHCPMVWYHRLCSEVESLTDRKTQAAIFRRVDQLDESEQSVIITKFRGAETDSLREQNEFLMMLLRAHCEMKQGKHIHDTVENRTEFLNQYLGGNTIFMKAKRSLSNSFDHLLKRKASKDDFNPILKDLHLPLNRETSPNLNTRSDSDDNYRTKSSTIDNGDVKDTLIVKDNQNGRLATSPDRNLTTPKSPMMDIFFKVGSNPRTNHQNAPTTPTAEDENITPSITLHSKSSNGTNSDQDNMYSWRQSIFKRVITTPAIEATSGDNQVTKGGALTRKRTREELRELWRTSIHQAVLLVRMEKENARIKAQQESTAVKRIKLEYDELRTDSELEGASSHIWDTLTTVTNGTDDTKPLNHHLATPNNNGKQLQQLRKAIGDGVPRGKRGDVWRLLAEEYEETLQSAIDEEIFPNYHVSYECLLRRLTAHQHAILIDLGRTFPNHEYYRSPLGPGQLALFNLLKAYSLLDPAVGYCQGLSFVAGILLLHLEEADAFYLLRHLMFRRKLREQYLPDMGGLQVRLYQLSRLIHDKLPDIQRHLDEHEVDPTLYAAPWLLTIFASQFPLGFVARVFDLIFLEGTDVLFRVALALLEYHRKNILSCGSFEEIMDYMKLKLATIDKDQLEIVMKMVHSTDFTQPLSEYSVEYTVLQEEMSCFTAQLAELHRLSRITATLTAQNRTLNTQLDLALTNVQRLEIARTVHQSAVNKLEVQSRSLEVTVQVLAGFISSLVREGEVEVPTEVKRIVGQVQQTERRRSSAGNFMNNLFKKTSSSSSNSSTSSSQVTPEGKTSPIPSHRLMVKSLSTGRIAIPEGGLTAMSRSGSFQTPPPPADLGNLGNGNNSFVGGGRRRNSGQNNFFSRAHKDILTSEIRGGVMTEEEGEGDLGEVMLGGTTGRIVITTNDVSPTGSVDSGVTVTTPEVPPSPLHQQHPLCGSADVSFTYAGTRTLKKV